MVNLLDNDFNEKNYNLELNNTNCMDCVELPNGHLGMTLTQYEDNCYYITDIVDDSPVINILEVGDLIVSINGELLSKHGPTSAYHQFKNIDTGRREIFVKRN